MGRVGPTPTTLARSNHVSGGMRNSRRPSGFAGCRDLPKTLFVGHCLMWNPTTVFALGVNSRSMPPSKDNPSCNGAGIGKVPGRVHTLVGLCTIPLGLPAAPRSSIGLAWGRETPSYRVWPRGGTIEVLMMERLCTGRGRLTHSASLFAQG